MFQVLTYVASLDSASGFFTCVATTTWSFSRLPHPTGPAPWSRLKSMAHTWEAKFHGVPMDPRAFSTGGRDRKGAQKKHVTTESQSPCG